MSAFGLFSKRFPLKTLQLQVNNSCAVCVRFLNYTPMYYDGNPDPGPIFIKPEVQSLLKTLTRIDLAKVFRKRKLEEKHLQKPVYKFMTDEQLQEAVEEAKQKVNDILQMPPICAMRKPRDKILEKNPALEGLDSSTFVFTDITYGLSDNERSILLREPDGTLKEADWEVRDRINQIYFPVKHRNMKIPKMFEDNYLEDLLKRGEYNFILDRACLQFEPNDVKYQQVVSITYQHLNDNNCFEEIRSTRHFGCFAFFLSWYKMVDNLLLDLIETEHIDEANSLIKLYSRIHNLNLTCTSELDAIDEFIKKVSSKKGALELAFQAYKNNINKRKELEEGIKRAHGLN